MASIVPAKSQPLHNFTLPQLKWNKDGHSSGHQHHRRRSMKSPSRRPNASPIGHSPLRDSALHRSPFRDSMSPRDSPVHEDCVGKQSLTPGEFCKQDRVSEGVKHSPSSCGKARHLPWRESASESEAWVRSRGALIECRRSNPKNSTSDSVRHGANSIDSDRATHKVQTKSKAKEVDATGIKRSKILIKIPCKNSKKEEISQDALPPKIDNNQENVDNAEMQEDEKINNNTIDDEIKKWNLRPRKPIRKPLNVSEGTVKNNDSSMAERSKAQSPSRNLQKRLGENENKCGGAAEKKEKRKLSISVALTKEEIDEDIFALTGSKPARRPKKRAKNIQKQLDASFPGLWLVSITADSYKVTENSLKG